MKKSFMLLCLLAITLTAAETMQALRWRLSQSRCLITGKVSQRVSAGLLIQGDIGHYTLSIPDARDSICLLVDYPKEKQMVDGDRLQVVAFDMGQYQYKTTIGSIKTVRRYTVVFSNAVSYALTNAISK